MARRRLGPLGWGVIALSVMVLAGAGVLLYQATRAKTPTASKTSGGTTKTGSTSTNGAKVHHYQRPPVGGGWLVQGTSTVIFIQWSARQDRFSGTAQIARLTGTAPTLKITSSSVAVSGTLKGNQITLQFGAGTEEFGTISTGHFTVNFPQTDGTLAPVTFVASSASEYNSDIDALHARVTSTNVSAQQAEARAAAEKAVKQAAGSVLGDINDLATDEATLSGQVTGVKGALATETKDLSTVRSSATTVSSCLTANSVGYDANSVGYDANSVGYSVNDVKREITTVQTGITALRAALATLQGKEKALPGYVPTNQPSPTAVTKAIATANGTVAQAVSTTNGYVSQANADVKAADTVARGAERSHGCSTTTVSPPTPVATIT